MALTLHQAEALPDWVAQTTWYVLWLYQAGLGRDPLVALKQNTWKCLSMSGCISIVQDVGMELGVGMVSCFATRLVFSVAVLGIMCTCFESGS